MTPHKNKGNSIRDSEYVLFEGYTMRADLKQKIEVKGQDFFRILKNAKGV